jgi:glycosyltransferase involved in cell wall biosynthesis
MTYGHMAADTQGLERAVASLTGNGTAMLRSRLELNRTAFLCVGRLVEQKGVRQLVGAWQALDPALKAEATLLFVGDGPEAGWLKEQVQETSSSIRYAGPVDYDQLHRYYAAADAFVIPTLEDNWSLVVPEAMACGLPILCSKYNGCWPELVHQSRNGWVFDPLDQSDMVRCLAECAKQREQLKQMGVESRVIVSQHTPTHAAESVFRACRIAWERVRGDEEVCANGSSDGRRSTA